MSWFEGWSSEERVTCSIAAIGAFTFLISCSQMGSCYLEEKRIEVEIEKAQLLGAEECP